MELRKLAAAALAVLLAAPLAAEVWNDPAGVAVTDSSQTVTFPRPFTDVLVINDSATDSVYVRLFWCGESTGAATTNSLEVKPGDPPRGRSFRFAATTEHLYRGSSPGYCAISLIGPAGGATVRVEGK
jgi:hypothetical protein